MLLALVPAFLALLPESLQVHLLLGLGFAVGRVGVQLGELVVPAAALVVPAPVVKVNKEKAALRQSEPLHSAPFALNVLPEPQVHKSLIIEPQFEGKVGFQVRVPRKQTLVV